MALNLTQKQEVVAELAEVASKAHSLVAADYSGLTVGQMTEMRKKARDAGVYLKVAKNTLVSRAVKDTDYAIVADELTGPLLYAFSQEDPGAAGRLMKEFAKANDKLKPRLVSLGGKLYPGSHVDVLDPGEAVKNAKGGQVRYRTDKAGIIHCTIGKADFDDASLKNNLEALLMDLIKAKPATAKGVFLQKVSVSSTMGPGVIVDQGTLVLK